MNRWTEEEEEEEEEEQHGVQTVRRLIKCLNWCNF